MMACAEYRDQLLDHALGQPATAAVQAHLAACPACAQELEQRRARGAEVDAAVRCLVNVDAPRNLVIRPARPAWRLRFAAAMLVIAAGALALWLVGDRQDRQAAEAAEAISRWRSPTASLLLPPSQPVYQGVNP